MRTLKRGATWPVGIVGGSLWEGCITSPEDRQRITSFWAAYKPNRTFPIDMAAFAVNLDLIFAHPDAAFDYKHVEKEEGFFLSQLGFQSPLELEPRANGCTKVSSYTLVTSKDTCFGTTFPHSDWRM